MCKLADHHDGEDDSRLDDERRQVSQGVSAPQQPSQPRKLCPFHELKEMVHDGKIFMVEQCTNLYFDRVEVISDLVESFQTYSALITNQPELAGEYSMKQVEQATYYEKISKKHRCSSTNGSSTSH